MVDLHQPITGLARSFGYALRGIWIARAGRNLRIHPIAVLVVALAAVAVAAALLAAPPPPHDHDDLAVMAET